MKVKTNLLITILLLIMFSIAQLSAQNIIFVTDDDLEQPQMEWLRMQGFNVTPFWQAKDINLVGQDTIDLLNSADLIIIGRSGPSTSFQDSAERVTWNALTPPALLICQWKARSSRLNFFNSTNAYHMDTEPRIAYGKVADPSDAIFANATIAADSTMDWCKVPHDFIENLEATNGEVVATYDTNSPLIVRWDANVPFYPGAGDSAAGPRTYFGMGNDNTYIPGTATKNSNFFPLTKNAKAVYLAEICRLLGIPVQEPVFGPADNEIIFVTDDLEQIQIDFLERQGFNVTPFWQAKDINLVGQDTIDLLNDADLIIIGRSGPSSSFQDSAERVIWNALTPPALLICPWKARSSRLNYFNSTNAYHMDTEPPVIAAKVLDPSDAIFADVTLAADSTMDWFMVPHDFIENLEPTNGEVIATYDTNSPLVVRWDANVPFYPGAGDSAAGPRTYIGMGNDNTYIPGTAVKNSNFFPLTREAKIVYLAEISRMLGITPPEIVYGPADFTLTYVTDDLEAPNMNFLKDNGFKVNAFWPAKDINLVGQDTIDLLNSADLIIIGRSGPSSSFQDSAERVIWNALTPPTMMICPWKARSSRLNYFNSTNAYHADTEPVIAVAKVSDPSDVIFGNVTVGADSTLNWFEPNPHDFIENLEPTNGEVVAAYDTNSPLVVRWDANVPFYPGAADSAAGPRTYFGMGNDNVYQPSSANKISNFFPLTPAGQQVYFNEICRMLGAETVKVIPSSIDADLDDIQYDVVTATFAPDFDPAVFEYTLSLVKDSNVVTLTAIPSDANATVIGDSTVDVSAGDTITVGIRVISENAGVVKLYNVTVQAYVEPPEAVEEVAATDNIRVYPNPVKDVLTIETEYLNSRITIYNSIGKVVMEHKADNNLIRLNVKNLDAGIYLIRIEDSENVVIRKFFKE
jgi:hypothetical protein